MSRHNPPMKTGLPPGVFAKRMLSSITQANQDAKCLPAPHSLHSTAKMSLWISEILQDSAVSTFFHLHPHFPTLDFLNF